jgi:two-component system sensor histidine kinase GlrK
MTREIAKGKFEEIDNIASPPEIKELSDDFNLMCERLRELDEMKKDFISHVSHTLRTPLTAMKEASRMLMEGTYADVPVKQNELLAITQKECERLIDSVNRILDLSRMEAKMMDYQLKRGLLFPVIQQTVLKLAPIAQRKKIDLELRPSPNLPTVKMDEERIAQVMENLIGNALKFTAPGGTVIIVASLKNQSQHWIEVCVADSGCGIPRENMGKIFDRFQRIDGGRKTPLGTGLGLSIAKHIVADHGGKIWVRSKPGQGSSFYFSLPVS